MNRKSALLAAIVAFAVAFSARSQEIVHFEKGPAVDLRELAKQAPMPVRARSKQHVKPLELPYQIAPAWLEAEPQADQVTKPVISAPPVTLAFTADNSRVLDPADSSGAAGKDHIVALSNEGFSIHNRSGQRLLYTSLMQFWFIDRALDIYDPRIVYDARNDRWITMAIMDEREVAVAVSRTGDPTGTWDRWYLPVPGCDFSRLALTRDTVMFSTNVDYDGRGTIWSVNKSALYAAPASLPAKAYEAFMQHVPVSGPDTAEEWVVQGSHGDLSVNRLQTMFSQPWRRVVSSTDFFTTNWMSSQKGSTRELDLGFGWIENAVLHDGVLYAVQTGLIEDADRRVRAGIAWWKVSMDPKGGLVTGFISEESGRTNRAFPSVAVNSAGAMLITYSRVSADEHPTAVLTYVDASGRMSEERVIKAGDSPAGTFSGRWGDYTATVSDPVNTADFWAMQIYGTNGKWHSVVAQVKGGKARRRAIRH